MTKTIEDEYSSSEKMAQRTNSIQWRVILPTATDWKLGVANWIFKIIVNLLYYEKTKT